MTPSSLARTLCDGLAVLGIAAGAWLIDYGMATPAAPPPRAALALVAVGVLDVLVCVAAAGWSLHRRLKSAGAPAVPWLLLLPLPAVFAWNTAQVVATMREQQQSRGFAQRHRRLGKLDEALRALNLVFRSASPADPRLWQTLHDRYWQLHEELRNAGEGRDAMNRLDSEVRAIQPLFAAALSPATPAAERTEARDTLLAHQAAALRITRELRGDVATQWQEADGKLHGAVARLAAAGALAGLLLPGAAALLLLACRDLVRRARLAESLPPPAPPAPPAPEGPRVDVRTLRAELQRMTDEVERLGRAAREAETQTLARTRELDSLIDHLPLGYFRLAPDGRLVRTNVLLATALELPAGESTLKDDSVVPTWPPTAGEHRIRARRKDGEEVALAVTCRPVRDSGGELCYTEGFVAELPAPSPRVEEHRRNELLLACFDAATADGLLVLSRGGKCLYRNAAFEQLWQIPAGELADAALGALLAVMRPQAAGDVHGLEQRLRAPSRADGPFALALRDGRALEVTARVIVDETTGEAVHVAAFRDVTARTVAEAQHKAARERAAESEALLGALPAALLRYDVTSDRCTYAGAGIAAELGRDPHQLTQQHPFLPFLVHADDLADVRQHLQVYAARPGEAVCEMMFRVPIGRAGWRWVHARLAGLHRGEDGCVKQVMITAFDITARRLAEDEARRTTERLAALLDAAPGVVWEAGGDLRPTYVSRHAEALLGRAPQECLADAAFWAHVLHEADRAQALDRLSCLRHPGDAVQFPVRLRHVDGREVWGQLAAEATADREGHVQVAGVLVPADAPPRAAEPELPQVIPEAAREFDDALSAILGHADVALGSLPADHRLLGPLEAIREAAGRVAEARHRLAGPRAA